MPLFSNSITFKEVDPLDDGLREEIIREQLEPEAITLDEAIDEGRLSEYWENVEKDIEQDPEWFRFTSGE